MAIESSLPAGHGKRVGQTPAAQIDSRASGLSLTTVFFGSAWLLERNRWIGAVFPAAWCLYGIANTYLVAGRHLSTSAVTLPVELGIMFLAFRDLWPLRAVRETAEQ
jgi:hypothetical protein